jgi:hypothetical protein
MMTRDEAKKVIENGDEAVIRKLQELSAEVDRLKALSPESPTTPSGQKPPYLKEQKKKRKKKPGQKPGHKGVARTGLRKEDAKRTVHHPLTQCPDCGLALDNSKPHCRSRLVEDIPELAVEVVEHIVERKWCPACEKTVEAPVCEALPGSVIGIRLAVFTAFLHYFIGVSLRHITKLLEISSGHRITIGALFHIWSRLATRLEGEYDRIAQQVRTSRVMGGDETGWRIAGRLAWLWAFVTDNACIYLIEPLRSGNVIKRFLGGKFAGTLICDFFSAYNRIETAFKQRCLYHLFTELKKVDQKTDSPTWKAWRKLLVRLLRDGVRLGRKFGKIPAEEYSRLTKRLHERLGNLFELNSRDPNVKRLSRRLHRHRNEIFTFLNNPHEISPYNNDSERIIRPSVIMRKISQQNRSYEAARVQAILMTVFRTAHLRNQNPFETVLALVQKSIAEPQHQITRPVQLKTAA